MILQWRLQLAALAAVVFFAQLGVFFLYAATSCQLPSRYADALTGSNGGELLRALVVSDIHLLGKRRRSWIERLWIDWQVRMLLCVCVCDPVLIAVHGAEWMSVCSIAMCA